MENENNGFQQTEQNAGQNVTAGSEFSETSGNFTQAGAQYGNNSYVPAPEGGNGFAIAGMVLGILSIVCCCVWRLSLIMAVLSLVFSIITVTQNKPGRGMAVAGIVCSVVGIILVAALLIMAYAGMNSADYQELLKQIEAME